MLLSSYHFYFRNDWLQEVYGQGPPSSSTWWVYLQCIEVGHFQQVNFCLQSNFWGQGSRLPTPCSLKIGENSLACAWCHFSQIVAQAWIIKSPELPYSCLYWAKLRQSTELSQSILKDPRIHEVMLPLRNLFKMFRTLHNFVEIQVLSPKPEVLACITTITLQSEGRGSRLLGQEWVSCSYTATLWKIITIQIFLLLINMEWKDSQKQSLLIFLQDLKLHLTFLNLVGLLTLPIYAMIIWW